MIHVIGFLDHLHYKQHLYMISIKHYFYILGLLVLGTYGCDSPAELTKKKADEVVSQQVETSQTGARVAALSNDDRRAFLKYYSPVIFKNAHEYDGDHLGYDWLTNFYFDGDQDLTNNKANWSEELDHFIDKSAHANWKIRPTLYTSIIEFYDYSLNTKSVILLYHVYHAKQRGSIHDWERIEIRVDGINGAPGNGEEINYVVITRHELHNAREYPNEDLNFMETASGKHVMIWQADWDLGITLGTAELHFVEDSWSTINSRKQSNGTAKVDINDSGDNYFHYVFVDENDASAVTYWGAQHLTQANAATLASGKSQGDKITFGQAKNITYELQDIADIIPTHLSNTNWTKLKQVQLADPVRSESGAIEVPAGIQNFYYESLDSQDDGEDRDGFIRKHWFWGVYYYGDEGDYFYDQLNPEPWAQHQYFAHNGTRGNATVADELANRGVFLGKGTYANWLTDGGFDGRWVQLFQD
jgi:hypothetical protein